MEEVTINTLDMQAQSGVMLLLAKRSVSLLQGEPVGSGDKLLPLLPKLISNKKRGSQGVSVFRFVLEPTLRYFWIVLRF
jgi:hypothetical protein